MPPIPTKPASPWSEPRRITVSSSDPGCVCNISAECMGALAVHEVADETTDLSLKGLWCLCHIHTGLWIVRLKTREECKKVGEYLWSKHCLVFRERSAAEVDKATPPWLRSWLKAMAERGEYFPPTPS